MSDHRRIVRVTIVVVVVLFSIVAATSLLIGRESADASPEAAAKPTFSERPVQGPSEAYWVRKPTVEALVEASVSVVRATVVSVEDAPPITAEEAKAPPGTPSLAREVVEFRLDAVVGGSKPPDRFKLVRFPLPGMEAGSPWRNASEDKPYNSGEQYVLFLRPPAMPGRWQPENAFVLASLDGRLRVAQDGGLRGYLPDGVAEQVRGAQAELASRVREMVR